MKSSVQVLVVLQESLPQVDISGISGVDVLEVVSLLEDLLRVAGISTGVVVAKLPATENRSRPDTIVNHGESSQAQKFHLLMSNDGVSFGGKVRLTSCPFGLI